MSTSRQRGRETSGLTWKRRQLERRRNVDVRPLSSKIADGFVDPLWIAAGLMVLTLLVAVFQPFLIHLVLLVVLPIVALVHLSVREVRLPFRMPIGADCVDLGHPKPGYTGFEKSQGMILIGYDLEHGNAQVWAARTDMLGHLLILGKTGAGKTEGILSLFANFLSIGAGGIMVDAKGDPKAIFQMYELLRRLGAEDDLLVLDYMTGGQSTSGRQRARKSNTCNPFASGSADACFQIMSSMIKTGDGQNNVFSDRALALMTAVLQCLCELRDLGEIALGPGTIREYLPMDKLKGLLDHPRLSDKTKRELRTGYLQMLPGYKDEYHDGEERQQAEMLNQHGYAISYFARSLGSFASTYGHIFFTSFGEVDFTDVCMNKRVLMVALPPLEKSPAEMQTIGKINLALLKEVFARSMGTKLEGRYEEVIENRPSASLVPFLIVLDEYAYIASEGIGVIPAQARGLGFCVVFAGQDWGGFEAGDKTAAQQIWGSTTLKIIGVVEDPETLRRMVDKMGKSAVPGASEFQVDGSPTPYIGRVDMRESDIISTLDLQRQTEGMGHMTAFGDLFRMSFFYAGPGGKLRFRVNRFLRLGDREGRRWTLRGDGRPSFYGLATRTGGGSGLAARPAVALPVSAPSAWTPNADYGPVSKKAEVALPDPAPQPVAPMTSMEFFTGGWDAEPEAGTAESGGLPGFLDSGMFETAESGLVDRVNMEALLEDAEVTTVGMGTDVIEAVKRELLATPAITRQELDPDQQRALDRMVDDAVALYVGDRG